MIGFINGNELSFSNMDFHVAKKVENVLNPKEGCHLVFYPQATLASALPTSAKYNSNQHVFTLTACHNKDAEIFVVFASGEIWQATCQNGNYINGWVKVFSIGGS